ncbi:MAG TPA: replication-relaxation family protein [Sphingomicrobium sp.]|nr:replication-relaxation family protein [Sphingomicrobium sp.]
MTTPTRPSNSLQAKQRQETDDKVVAAFEKHGVLSRAQVVEQTGFDDEAVRRAMDRLRDAGMIQKLKQRDASGKGGRQAALYALGTEEDAPIERGPTEILIHRHPQDVAFFGEYRRVA